MRLIYAGLMAVGLAVAVTTVSPLARQQSCLHGSEQTPERKTRRSQMIGLARDINNQQLQAVRSAKSYQPLAMLTLGRPVPDGMEVRLAAEAKTYGFSIVDKTDPCRSGVFSNEAGVIYTGQALQ